MSKMYHPERQPLSIDVHDDDALRAWLARQVQDEVMARGHPLAAIRLLKDGYQEIIDWARLVEGEPEADLAATWAMLLRLPMVER
ncbi:MAG TPA: hypothetical protein PLA94_25640, partial [Myxococcota bacterium]|nr:hypothetical protein [Myxococcota bacterium]